MRRSLAAALITMVFMTRPVSAGVELRLPDERPQLVLAAAGVHSGDALSVDDLGFTKEDVENDLSQKDLDTRSDMLKIHQVLGLVTAVPMITQFVIGLSTADSVAQGNNDTSLHTTLGIATFALYGTAAAFQILAPKPKHKKQTGDTAIHEALSWIHLPLMIAVILTGDVMNDRLAAHQPLGNLGAVHGVMATTLLGTYLTSLTIMTF